MLLRLQPPLRTGATLSQIQKSLPKRSRSRTRLLHATSTLHADDKDRARIRLPFSDLFASSSSTSELVGTAPYHRALLLLHSASPISAYPPRMNSPLAKALLMAAMKSNVEAPVNFVHFPLSASGAASSANTNPPPEMSAESLEVTAYLEHWGRVELGTVSVNSAQTAMERVSNLLSEEPPKHLHTGSNRPEHIDIFVCTHGARDCRCGDTGGAVAAALRAELTRRGGELERKVRVGEVGHVGGHKWAANVLVYPSGDWLAKVTPSDVPTILSEILAPLESDPPYSLPCAPHWRGKLGMPKEVQQATYASHTMSGTQT